MGFEAHQPRRSEAEQSNEAAAHAAASLDSHQPFTLHFDVAETLDSTEERPILSYERNGFTFEAKLDLHKATVEISLVNKRVESYDSDWQRQV
jgi:hypothetical protein